MKRLEPLGDRGVLVTLGRVISPEVHREVRRVTLQIVRMNLAGVSDVVPSFASIAVHYDPAAVHTLAGESPHESIVRDIERAVREAGAVEEPAAPLVDIPVCYGGAFGPDLADLAAAHAMAPERVIELHSAPEYLVYMLGFLPGFAYMGGLNPELATPRRATPRTRVPAGSVGIGGSQTGVYPFESPGGWHLIGRTPLRLFEADRARPTLLSMGDRARFRGITAEEFRELGQGDGALDLRSRAPSP